MNDYGHQKEPARNAKHSFFLLVATGNTVACGDNINTEETAQPHYSGCHDTM